MSDAITREPLPIGARIFVEGNTPGHYVRATILSHAEATEWRLSTFNYTVRIVGTGGVEEISETDICSCDLPGTSWFEFDFGPRSEATLPQLSAV